MEVFLKIMTMDEAGLLKRRSKSIPVREVIELLTSREQMIYMESDGDKILPKYKKGISAEDKHAAISQAWNRMSYDQKLTYCLRPEEIDDRDEITWRR